MQHPGTDIVADPVGHISISGVHGRDELEARLASVPASRVREHPGLGRMIAAVLVGAAVMYLLHPDRRARRHPRT